MSNGTVLIADDDLRVNELLQDIFSMEGYEVLSAANGQEVLRILERDRSIDLLLLDVMMPVLDGWDVLGYIRAHYDVRVLMLTALDNEESEVRSFREGADDFVAKPFSRAVLLERSRRLIQEKYDRDRAVYSCGPLQMSLSERRVHVNDEEVKLTAKEFELLHMLLDNSGIILSRDRILNRIWGADYEGESRTVDTHVKMLRRSLGSEGQRIRTVRGIGYSFEGEVERT